MRCLVLPSFVPSIVGLPMASATAQKTLACDRFAWSVKREQVAFAAPDLPVLTSGSALPAEEMGGTPQLEPVAEVGFPLPTGRIPEPDSCGGLRHGARYA